MSSPTQRSLAVLRERGYIAQVVERWNPFARIRQDLFGVVDVLAVGNGETIAVQCTSGANVAEAAKAAPSRLSRLDEYVAGEQLSPNAGTALNATSDGGAMDMFGVKNPGPGGMEVPLPGTYGTVTKPPGIINRALGGLSDFFKDPLPKAMVVKTVGEGVASGFENRKRERVWFSPHCLSARQASLLDVA